MARGAYSMGLTLILLAMMCATPLAQPSCAPTITSLAPCLGFITGNSSSTSPSSACCTQLASIIQTQTQCLCTVLNGAPQLPFVVNQTRALTLPGACKIQTTPLSPCNAAASGQLPPAAAGSPIGAPAPAPEPEPASPSTPSESIAPSPTFPSTPSDATPTSPSTPTVPSDASPTASATPVPQAPSGDGSKTVPTTNQSSSAKIATSYPPALLVLLLVASAFSAF
ncbi:non-specific lipid-transfer protein-like protein [Iris pallida]|uniref:Non-specific lipid-transfer protein-like protein n=1 Tax=Iris pallida TaxID=29817 RepID=A0AAX6I144_IRIPA|nr:non-specific lipid-transfer protein-like protein [Iris pallida]